jgi:hypothetical protein
MVQVVKPRCRYVQDANGKIVGWLIHGFGIKKYNATSINDALRHWYVAAVRKILKQQAA